MMQSLLAKTHAKFMFVVRVSHFLIMKYECVKCEKETSNKTWLEQTLREIHMELVNTKGAISNIITFRKLTKIYIKILRQNVQDLSKVNSRKQ